MCGLSLPLPGASSGTRGWEERRASGLSPQKARPSAFGTKQAEDAPGGTLRTSAFRCSKPAPKRRFGRFSAGKLLVQIEVDAGAACAPPCGFARTTPGIILHAGPYGKRKMLLAGRVRLRQKGESPRRAAFAAQGDVMARRSRAKAAANPRPPRENRPAVWRPPLP